MLDCDIGLTGKYPKKAAPIPTAGEAWVERERTVDQSHHRTDILAERRQYEGGVGEDARIVLPHLERLPSKIASLAAGCLRFFDPAVIDEHLVAIRAADSANNTGLAKVVLK